MGNGTRIAVLLGLIVVSSLCHSAEEPAAAPKQQRDSVRGKVVEECKATKNETKMADCIEHGLYDPCDYGGGIHSWIYAQCAWGHAEVADRKIKRLEGQISSRLKASERHDALAEFQKAEELWRQGTDAYCKFTTSAGETGAFEADDDYLSYGFCMRRLKEQRVKELKPYITSRP